MPYTTVHLQVSKANFLQNTSIFSPAPIFAAIMAMHALDKELGKIGSELGVRGVGILHHDAKLWAEYLEGQNGYLQTEPVHRRGATLFDSGPKPPTQNPMQPMILGDLEWTLLLSHEFPVDRDAVTSVLSGMRFAGGTITSFRGHDQNHGIEVQCFEDGEKAIQSLRSGFWVDDATYLLESSQYPMKDLLVQQRRNAWMVPANLGYALLETPKNRPGARESLPHAFAEHLIGLVQYRSIHKVRNEISDERLWRWRWKDDQFFVSNYQPLLA